MGSNKNLYRLKREKKIYEQLKMNSLLIKNMARRMLWEKMRNDYRQRENIYIYIYINFE